MNVPPDEIRHRLSLDAESCEETADTGSSAETDIEVDQPRLARTVRMHTSDFPPDGASPETLEVDDTHTVPPSRIGRFRVKRQLGTGSFGTVWLAYDPVLKRDVAVKVAHVGAHASPDMLERFEREAHLAARLHHPNIVPVFEAGEDNSQLFIVSEYCAGQNLSDWLREQGGPVAPMVAARIIRQLADAAEHAHHQGLIHRDIKPGNVLLATEGATSETPAFVPRLTDFGLARDLNSESSATRTGMVVGTVKYMSPEQAAGESELHGPASDVYALGVLLYRMISGHPPFTGRSEFDIIEKIVNAEPVSPARIANGIPRDLSSICLKCIEKQPGRRYPDGGALRDDIDRFLRDEPTLARPITYTERLVRWVNREPAAAALLVVSVIALSVIVAGMSFHLHQADQSSQELTEALANARRERESARQARDDETAAREVAERERQFARETSYLSDMRLAFELLKRGQSDRGRELLRNHVPDDDPDLRGPEWFVLQADLDARSHVLGQHERSATDLALSADRRIAYTSGEDGLVRTWDLETGTEVRSFHAKIGKIYSLALSPDGSTIAVGGEPILVNAEVQLLDAESGEWLSSLQAHKTTIESIQYSPDGRWLAAGARYRPVQLTRLADGKTFTLPSERRNRTVSFSPDSRLLAVGATSDRVDLWPVSGEEPEPALEVPGYQRGSPYIMQFAPGGSRLATAYRYHKFVSLCDQPGNGSACLAMEATAHSRSARFKSLGFSPSGQCFAAGDEAGSIVFWHPESAENSAAMIEPTVSLTPHQATVSAIAFTSESDLISTGEDGRVCVTNPFASGASHRRWSGIVVSDSVVSGKELLLACTDGTIRRRAFHFADAGRRQVPCVGNPVFEEAVPDVLVNGTVAVECLAVSPDGQIIAAGTQQGGVRLFDRKTGALIQQIIDDTPDADVAVRGIAFSASGSLLAYTGRNGYAAVYDIPGGADRFRHFVSNGKTVRFLDEDRFLAASCAEDRLEILDAQDGEVSRAITGASASAMQLCPAGTSLFCGQDDGRLLKIDPASGEERIIARHIREIQSVMFSCRGRSVMSLDEIGNLTWTDVQSATVLGTVSLPNRLVDEAEYSDVLCHGEWLVVVTSAAESAVGDGPASDLYVWSLTDP